MAMFASLMVLHLLVQPAAACPEAVLGDGTSTATLTEATVSDARPYVLHLALEVSDHPKTQRIRVSGEEVEARVEHETPLTLAAWARHLTLQMGGSSKFVVGGIMATDTGAVALVPYASVLSMRILQGDDFDESSPFRVDVDLVLLHRPEPFRGERQPFVPRTGWLDVAGERFEALPAVPGGDPYGSSYGDYFSDPEYVASFVHGPRFPEVPGEVEPPGQHGGDRGWRSSPMVAAGLHPQDSLYEFVGRTYGAIQPTAALGALVGHPVVFVLVGDRTLVPPSSPWSDYHQECRFVPGRTSGTAPSPQLATWIERKVDGPVLWAQSTARLPGGGPNGPQAPGSEGRAEPRPRPGPREGPSASAAPAGPGMPGVVRAGSGGGSGRAREAVPWPWMGIGGVLGGVLGVLGVLLGRRWSARRRA